MANYMGPLDYVIFSALLLVSFGIGIFYSFTQKKSSEYLRGQKSLTALPVGMSMSVSSISALALQGLPAESFLYGVEPMFILMDFLSGVLAIFTFVPLFYPLNLTSTYEYLSMRYYSRGPRVLAAVLEVATGVFYAGVVILAPAQALQSMTGLPVSIGLVVMITVCTVYTALGGIKAVVWADVFQSVVMIFGILLVIVVGFLILDSDFDFHYELEKRNRLTLNFSASPFLRNSVWTYVWLVFYRFHWYKNQYSLMRYNAVKTLKEAKAAILIAQVFNLIVMAPTILTGLVIYAYYAQKGCDPLAAGEILTANQILPYFMLDALNYPCIPGLFASVIAASSLSTISSVLNALCAVAWTEIFSLKYGDISDPRKTLILKITVVIVGFMTLATSFAAHYLGGTFTQISTTANSIAGVGSMSIFLIGAIFPFIGPAGCVIGSLIAVMFILWITLGRITQGTAWEKAQLINDTCQSMTDVIANTTWPAEQNIYNATRVFESKTNGTVLENLYSISPYLYMIIGTSIGACLTLLISSIPALRMKRPVDAKLLFPFMRRFYKPTAIVNQSEKADSGEEVIKLRNRKTLSVEDNLQTITLLQNNTPS